MQTDVMLFAVMGVIQSIITLKKIHCYDWWILFLDHLIIFSEGTEITEGIEARLPKKLRGIMSWDEWENTQTQNNSLFYCSNFINLKPIVMQMEFQVIIFAKILMIRFYFAGHLSRTWLIPTL